MVCFHPIKAFYPLETDEQGKRYLKFGRNRRKYISESLGYFWLQEDDFSLISRFDLYDNDNPIPVFYSFDGGENGLNIKVPCGKCIGCKLDYSRSWALRSMHEAQLYDNYTNCSFVTLTFNDEMMNRRENPHSLNKKAFRTWIKRLRKAIKCDYGKEIRLMACGEYGSKHKRPHYHIIIYGFNFPDKRIWKYTRIRGQDIIYYRSPFLEKIWTPAHSFESYGFSVIGEVNFESSAYVARYCTKKLFGKQAIIYNDIEHEFLTTSRMPGIGYFWLKKYFSEIFNRGFCYNHKGYKVPIPKYYVYKLQQLDEQLYIKYRIETFQKLCDNLFQNYSDPHIDNTHMRLLAREEFKKMNLDLLIRQYEFN